MSAAGNIVIRNAQIEDLSTIANILESLGYPQSEYEELAKTFNEIASRTDMGILVATRANIVLGLLTYSFKPQLRFSGLSSFEIDELGVLPNARGSGIGKLLLDKAREIANSVSAKRIILSTNRQRESYQRDFYTKNGFIELNSAFMKYELLIFIMWCQYAVKTREVNSRSWNQSHQSLHEFHWS